MSKVLFSPFGIAAGILAGIIGKKAFGGLWQLVDKQQAPNPEHRDVPWKKLVPALLLEGAIFRAVRGILDRGSRQAFHKLTGSWPGPERPEPA